ncbi:hypothetical protein GPECTOR_1g286 [Gonium pectorale]|uniref:Cytochrome P450 n=1 Tax=Gonium pectorale TaxID=33097 RepID=A0A150H2R8_GONPE|nr:hypothetical protein GPECTOR_1g286 [Gonium pectorale]|eukprot:KXZ56324.1 hypothetical protein GPECTOR_1g286 [Gonium pectorale]
MVYGEDPVRTVLAAEDRLVASDWPQVTSVLVGPDSLNLLSGQRHGAVKRALSEAFGERQIRAYVPRIGGVVQEYVERWARGQQPTPGFASCQELSQAVFDAVVLGGDGSQERSRELQACMARLASGFQTPPVELPFTDYGKAVAARRAFGVLVMDAIARYRATSASRGPSSVLEELVAAAAAASAADPTTAAHQLSDSVIEDNMAAAFFGNASTGPSLAKALQHLAARPEDLMERHGTAITADVLDGMKFGAAVGKELLRITPAVPAVFRVAAVDFDLQGRQVPKLLVTLAVLARDYEWQAMTPGEEWRVVPVPAPKEGLLLPGPFIGFVMDLVRNAIEVA